MTADQELEALRAQLDSIDGELLELLARRFAVIEAIGTLKHRHEMAVVQPDRVRAVLDRRAARAERLGLNPHFIRRLWTQIIAEACAVERRVIGMDNRALAHQALRIDHVAIAVRELDTAVDFFRSRLGFDVVERWSIEGAFSGMDAAVMEAGAVSVVLVAGTTPESNVSRYIEHYGPGVQHIALEVDDIDGARAELTERDFAFVGGIYDVGGLKQIFSRRDANSGTQFEIVSRGSSARFEKDNVRSLFEIMEREGVY